MNVLHAPHALTRIMLLAGVLALVLFARPAQGQNSIELRASARVDPGAALRLSDLAVLEGPDAVALEGREIVPAARRTPGVQSLTLEQLRAALEQGGKINWGRISLRGSECKVYPLATPAPSIALEAPHAKPVIDDEACLRGAVMRRIGQVAQAIPDDLHITFCPDDDDFLAMPTASRTVEVKVVGMSERLPLAVTLYEGEHIVASRTIRVSVQVRRQVPIASSSKRKGETLDHDDLSTQEQWLPLGSATATLDQLIGAVVKARIVSGQAVSSDDVFPPLVANKGDQVVIHCISGGVVVTTRARAMAAAHDGETIEFQSLDGDKRRFTARMNGRGRAVVTTADSAENTR